jgi:hypothetical protein
MAQVESTPGKSIPFGSVAVAASQITTQQNPSPGVLQPSTIAVLTTVTPYKQVEPGVTYNPQRS